MSNSQIPAVVDELKRALKAKGLTYAELAKRLELSEPAIKRTFAQHKFSLDRLEKIAALAGLELAELFERCARKPPAITQLSIRQEQELFGDIKLLLMANLVLNRWSFDDILEHFEFDQHEAIRALARLDRMRMIELLPGNSYRLLVSRRFSWRRNGPVQRFFKTQVQTAFFDSQFDQAGEKLAFLSGMLSRANLVRFGASIDRLAAEFDELAQEDEGLPVTERFTTSLVVALRPWTFPPFVPFRRRPKQTRP